MGQPLSRGLPAMRQRMICSRLWTRLTSIVCAAGISLLSACSTPAVVSNQRPPHVDPVAFRVHTVLVDMPVARLRELLPALGNAEPLSRTTIDENGTRERLLEIARGDPSLV